MKTLRFTFLYLAIVLFTGSAYSENHETEQRTELETYIWLEREAMFDTDVPDSEIHDLIAKGLQHDDPEIVLCSVGAMSMFIGMYKLRIEEGGEPVVDDRNLQDIPGLYDTLMNMWNEGWKEAGGSMPVPTMRDDLVERLETEQVLYRYLPLGSTYQCCSRIYTLGTRQCMK